MCRGDLNDWSKYRHTTYNTHHNRFTALFLGPTGWAGARRELLDFMVQEEINRGRHTDHPAGRHSIWTNQCPPPPSLHIFNRPDALPAAQPTVSKHWRQLTHSDYEKTLEFSSTVLPAPSPYLTILIEIPMKQNWHSESCRKTRTKWQRIMPAMVSMLCCWETNW